MSQETPQNNKKGQDFDQEYLNVTKKTVELL